MATVRNDTGEKIEIRKKGNKVQIRHSDIGDQWITWNPIKLMGITTLSGHIISAHEVELIEDAIKTL